jgi:protein TonB
MRYASFAALALASIVSLAPLAARADPPANTADAPVAPPVAADPGPRWVRRPDGDDMARAYPAKAQAKGVSGGAVLSCAVLVTGWLGACDVIKETPPDFGFGAASLRVAKRFRLDPAYLTLHPPSADHRVIIPMVWRMPG